MFQCFCLYRRFASVTASPSLPFSFQCEYTPGQAVCAITVSTPVSGQHTLQISTALYGEIGNILGFLWNYVVCLPDSQVCVIFVPVNLLTSKLPLLLSPVRVHWS